MDPYKVLFYVALGTVVVIVSIVRIIGWRKEKIALKQSLLPLAGSDFNVATILQIKSNQHSNL
jgi:uncharacterized membrane protein YkgB